MDCCAHGIKPYWYNGLFLLEYQGEAPLTVLPDDVRTCERSTGRSRGLRSLSLGNLEAGYESRTFSVQPETGGDKCYKVGPSSTEAWPYHGVLAIL